MAFWTYRQNNSGGSFDIRPEDGVSCYVVIEAHTTREANSKAEDLGLYFNDEWRDCQTCGDRWYELAEGDQADVPSYYGEPFELKLGKAPDGYGKWAEGPEIYIHYADGRIEGYDY